MLLIARNGGMHAAWLRCGLLSIVAVVVGCGQGKGKLSGQVLWNGAPLPGGKVTFRPADPKANPVVVELDEGGNYEVSLPTGEVLVSVDNRDLEPRPAPIAGTSLNLPPEVRDAISKTKKEGAPPAPPADGNQTSASPSSKPRGQYVRIPDKFYTIDTSGLKYTVPSGNQKQDIELK